MVSLAHSDRSVQETPPSQSIHQVAARGDRARRVSFAKGRIARFVLPVAAVACLASALAAVVGGPRAIGLAVLVVSAAAAGFTVLTARRVRVISDDAVAELDRAADLGGSLRSAYWFAGAGESVPRADPSDAWIAFHLEDAASRAAGVDWAGVYKRPSARLPWGMALVCALATLGVFAWPLPGLLTRPAHAVDAARAAVPSAPAIAASLVPQLVEGMHAMKSGRTPSKEQLSAIGQALEIAKVDPDAQKQIEALLARAGADPNDALWGQDADSDRDPRDVYNNGFELSDLNWAYQEAVARARVGERSRPDARSAASASEEKRDGKPGQRDSEPASSGSLNDVPVLADTRGQPVGFLSQLLGRQQASGEPGSADRPQSPGHAATLAAALRAEIVRARSDISVPDLDTPAARRATNAGRTPTGAYIVDNGVRYDRSRAMQPPAVPEARRSLVHNFFLRPADAGSPVKWP